MAIAAARIRAERPETNQVEIAARLQTSQAQVSRFLRYAEEIGFLQSRPLIVTENITKCDWDDVETRFFGGNQMVGRLVKEAPKDSYFEAHVLPSAGQSFFERASSIVLALLGRSQQIGVMSGKTIFELLEAMKRRQRDPHVRRKGANECIPLCGDPVHLINQRVIEYSASHLAGTLELIITGSLREDLPCLTGVPAYLGRGSRDGTRNTSAVWMSFVRTIPGYRRIFGQAEGDVNALVNGIDTILSGVGVIGRSQTQTAAFIQERIEQGDADATTLDDIAIGDVGGLLVPRKISAGRRRSPVDELNVGWTGAKWRHFQAVAKTASSTGRPGVIIVAAGPSKAMVTLELVRRGVVNNLLIDYELSDELRKVLFRNE
ncbi:MAG: hypothetical protein L0Z50_19240 [Verrucomicrobiales bacterium]|nr:hypothetical protein [Verrucomicrobiales bacterium]